MATDIVPQYLKIRIQGIHLRVPHKEAAAQGMTQNDHSSALLPRKLIIDVNTIRFNSH
jgi:hypothetical protein